MALGWALDCCLGGIIGDCSGQLVSKNVYVVLLSVESGRTAVDVVGRSRACWGCDLGKKVIVGGDDVAGVRQGEDRKGERAKANVGFSFSYY